MPASNDTNLDTASSINSGSVVTNGTGNFSIPQSRTFLHGGYHSTSYPLMFQVNWWGKYGNADHSYGGLYGS